MSFCSKCGTALNASGVCLSCTPAPAPAPTPPAPPSPPQPNYQQQPTYPPPVPAPAPAPPAGYPPQPAGYPYPPYQPVKVPVPHYAPGSFIEKLHNSAGSVLFLVAICLFSGGAVINAFLNFSDGLGLLVGFLGLGILALPITGFWMMFAASKVPKLPEKTMTSLKLFKASIIIDLIIMCLVGVLFLIAAIAMFSLAANATFAAGELTTTGIVLFLIAAGIVVFNIIYFLKAKGVINAIDRNIIHNTSYPIADVKVFSILTYIGVGFAVIGAIIPAVAISAIHNVVRNLPFGMDFIVGSFLPSVAMTTFIALLTMVYCAGIIIMVIVLNQFNDKLLGKAPPTYPPPAPHAPPPPPPQSYHNQ